MSNVILFYQQSLGGKTRGKHENCPICGGVMKRIYMKFQYCKNSTFRAVGWLCLECLHVEVDKHV
jgi:hypothetical protein